jgi:hypothetical protein
MTTDKRLSKQFADSTVCDAHNTVHTAVILRARIAVVCRAPHQVVRPPQSAPDICSSGHRCGDCLLWTVDNRSVDDVRVCIVKTASVITLVIEGAVFAKAGEGAFSLMTIGTDDRLQITNQPEGNLDP